MLVEKVKKFISANGLFTDRESLLVAFSGGADSMCLLHILKTLSYKVYAAHLNHGIRGKEAERDQDIAQAFCFKYGIPFFLEYADIPAIAEKEGISEETAGRNERYKFFTRIAEQNNIDKIVTAHNKNDNAETVLMHIIRGTGTDGLSGIPKIRSNIVRPLLCCSRSEIEDYCRTHSLPFVTDSTNSETVYTRNKVRLNLLPCLEGLNPEILSALTRLSELSLEDKNYFGLIIDELVADKTTLDVEKLENLHNAILFRVIMRLCDNAGVSAQFKNVRQVADALKSKKSGKRFDFSGGFIEISCGKISVAKSPPETFRIRITPRTDITVGKYHIKASDRPVSDIFFILPDDAEIFIRSRADGDKIKVRGMTKKISDIFIDKKIPSIIRDEIPLLEVDGEILYIFGLCKSDNFSKYTQNDKTIVLNISNKEYTNE